MRVIFCFLSIDPAVTVTGTVRVEMPAGVPEFPTAPVPPPPQETSTPTSNIHTTAAWTVFSPPNRVGFSLRHAANPRGARKSNRRIAVQIMNRGSAWTNRAVDADLGGPDRIVVPGALRVCGVVAMLT